MKTNGNYLIQFYGIAIVLIVLFGCNSAAYDKGNIVSKSSNFNDEKVRSSNEINEPSVNYEEAEMQSPASPTVDKGIENKVIREKNIQKIIKTASINMQVKNYKDARKKILEIIPKYGAYVANENETNDNYSLGNTMIIRVNCEKFDALVDELTAIAIYVNSKNINSEDITEQYIDAQARLKSKKEVEARYLEILKKANSVKDILEVEGSLRVIREEIEAYEGKLRYWNDRIAYSTITLYFYEKLDFVASPEQYSFWYKLGKGFKSGWKGLQLFFIGIVTLWPLWLIIGFVVWLVLRLIKRSRKKN